MALYADKSYDINQDVEIETVKGIQFSVLSPDEILKRSVCEVTKAETYTDNKPVPQGLFDIRMGSLDINRMCGTCGQSVNKCPNHIGHINLEVPVFNIMFIDIVKKILKCVCFHCSKLVVSPTTQHKDIKDDMARIKNIKNNQKRFEAYLKMISNHSSKLKHCGDDNTIGCQRSLPHNVIKEKNSLSMSVEWMTEDKEKYSIEISPEDVLRIFRKMTDKDIETIGFNPQWSRPEWLILTVLPVAPPAVRPSIVEENSARREDDITHKLCEIVRANNSIKEQKAKNKTDIYKGYAKSLQYHVITLMDNQIPGTTAMHRNGRHIKAIADRLKKKEGRIRGNLNAKRVDQSARSVITPHPYISIAELGVPLKVAMNLTFPEKVNKFNIDYLKSLVVMGPDNHPGAKYIRNTSGNTINLKAGIYGNSINRKELSNRLKLGDIVYRYLMDGDYVLFNRQPSLHKMSMMCHRAKVMPHKTFRLNVLDTPPYNADFDGDEMNLHLPQSIQTMYEIKDLAQIPSMIISHKSGKPIIEIVQDVLVGSYRLSMTPSIDSSTVANLQMSNSAFTGSLKDPTKTTYTGNELFSMILPPNLNIKTKNITIENSKITSSKMLGKKEFHEISNGLIPVIYHDYGQEEAMRFMDNTQRLICQWLIGDGFSIGVSDLVIQSSSKNEIKESINQMKAEVFETINKLRVGNLPNTSIVDKETFVERKLVNLLNKTNKVISEKCMNSVDVNKNRMMNMIKSGSKGKETNVSQIMGCVGQINVEGKRIGYGFTGRTLPHYTKYDDSAEARGFVENGFIDGLTPQEVFFHAMGGREGLIDTAVKSVVWDTPIIFMEGGKVVYRNIGEWIDEKLDNPQNKPKIIYHGEDNKNMELLKLDKPVMIPTCDEMGNVSWEDLTIVTRHDPGEKLFKITTKGGRSVTATDSKSVLVWKDGKYIEVSPKDLVIGDYLPVCKSIPNIPDQDQDITNLDLDLDIEKLLIDAKKGILSNDLLSLTKEYLYPVLQNYMDYNSVLKDDTMILVDNDTDDKAMNVNEDIAVHLFTRIGMFPTIKGSKVVLNDFKKKTQRDTILDSVVSIEEIICDGSSILKEHPKVYDVTVPSTKNFALANSLVVFDTSTTGYSSRKLVKSMEDARIYNDFTVRNANGMIIQYVYGEDGYDGSKIEKQEIPIMINIPKNENPYNILMKEFLITPEDNLNTYMLAKVATKASSQQTMKRCYEHFEDLVNDREYLINVLYPNIRKDITDNTIENAIPFARIIARARDTHMSVGMKRRKTDLDPNYVLDKIEQITRQFDIKKTGMKQTLIGILIRSYLSPKKLIFHYGFMKNVFDWIIGELIKSFKLSVASPGEMIGIVAAQTIGEMGTQMTLNSFHVSGTDAAVKATSGVPRLMELMSVSKNIKTPMMRIYLNNDKGVIDDGHDGINEEKDFARNKALRAKNNIEIVRLCDILEMSEIYWDDGFLTNIDEDKEFVEMFNMFRQKEGCSNEAGLVLRMVFDKEKMSLYQITMIDISTRINVKYGHIVNCVFSDDNSHQCVMRIEMENKEIPPLQNSDFILNLKAIEHNLIYNMPLKGVKNIKKVSMEEETQFVNNPDTMNIEKRTKWVLTTDGTNLVDILSNPNVDPELTISNDIREIYEVLGIEAARTALGFELNMVIGEGAMNYRHLSVLLDTMTMKGNLMSIDRHGINRSDIGALTKSSFEEPTDMLVNAAVFSEYEPLNAVSGNVMIGAVPPSGTGTINIVLDEQLYANLMKDVRYDPQPKGIDIPDDGPHEITEEQLDLNVEFENLTENTQCFNRDIDL